MFVSVKIKNTILNKFKSESFIFIIDFSSSQTENTKLAAYNIHQQERILTRSRASERKRKPVFVGNELKNEITVAL